MLSESRVVFLEAGDKAPYEGWLLTDGAVVELTECCEDSLEEY